MKPIFFFLAAAVLLLSSCPAMAQAPRGDTRTASRPSAAVATQPSSAQAAAQQAAGANKFVFLFFYRQPNQQVNDAWGVFQPAAAKLGEAAAAVPVNVSDAAEKAMVDQYGVSRAPMPLVLAVAPNGAITKSFTTKFEEAELRTALVSPCTQRCLKALQDRKLVLLCVQEVGPDQPATAPQGAADFQADPNYARATETIVVNTADTAEEPFVKSLQVDPRQGAVTLLMAPPGTVVGKFAATATKQQLVATLAATQANPCAGGKCGPNGCGPKK